MRPGILHSLYKFFPARECDKYTVYILLTLLLSAFKGTLASGTTQSVSGKQTLVAHALSLHAKATVVLLPGGVNPDSETRGFQRASDKLQNLTSL